MSIMQSLFGGGNFPSQPTASGTTVATTEFPKELAPFIKDILEKSKAMQQDASYQPYTGPQIAPFTPLEQDAMTALEAQSRGLAGTDIAQAAPYFTGAKTAIEGLGQQFTGDTAQQFMNPYQQAVTDQAKLKATEDYEKQQQVLAANAIKNQPFGGSRQAITEGMAQGDYLDRLTDIQERGLASAYTQGRAAFEAQKGRELQQAQQLMGMGATVPQQAYRDLGIRQQIGETQRAQDQMALDLGTKQFMEEREFPTRALQEYSATVRGFPFQPSTYQTQTSYQPKPGIGQQLINLAGQGLGGYTAFTGQPLQNLFKAEGGITTLPTYYNRRGENNQQRLSIYDLIDRSPEAQQFLEDEAAAQEQQKLAEDALNIEYEIEKENTKKLSDRILDMFYTPQRMLKKVIRKAEGGLADIPVYYNATGINNQSQTIVGDDGILYEYTPGQGVGGLEANVMMEPTVANKPWQNALISKEARDRDDKEAISNWFSGLGYKLTHPFSEEYKQGLQNNYTPNENNNINLTETDNTTPNMIDLETIIPQIDLTDTTIPEANNNNVFRELEFDPNSLQFNPESPVEESSNISFDLNNLDINAIRKMTDMNMETLDKPDLIDYKMSDVEKLNMLSDKIKTEAPDSYQDKVLEAFGDVDLKTKINNMIDTYTKIGSPEYATELKKKATERQALGQGLAMMKAFSSSDPTQGIIGNLSNQIGKFAEEVGPTEQAYLAELDQIDNLGVETPINSVSAIVDVINTAYNPAADRGVNVRAQDIQKYIADNDFNIKQDTLGFNLLQLLMNSNISEEDLKQKAVQINNNSRFNQKSLENDLLKSILSYKGTLATANQDLNKLKIDAVKNGYIEETDYNNIYKAVAAGIYGDQVIYEGSGLKTINGDPLDAATVMKINQAMGDIIVQVGNAKMFQSISGLSGELPEQSAAEIQARLISQYKVYFDDKENGLPALNENGQKYFENLQKMAVQNNKPFNKFTDLKALIAAAKIAQTDETKDMIIGQDPELKLSDILNIN